MKDKLKNFAENVKRKRLEQNKTLRKLAEESGVSATTISSCEKQAKIPSLENALSICEALGCTLDEMCGVDINQAKEDIETYREAFKWLMIAIDDLNGGIHNVTVNAGYPSPYGDIGIVFYDPVIRIFLTDWARVRELFLHKTIDEELYIAWQEKKLREYDIKIKTFDEIQFEELQSDDDLPF